MQGIDKLKRRFEDEIIKMSNSVEMLWKWLRIVELPLMCCGKKMEEVEAGAVDAALEKHVPVLKVEGDCLTAVVGDVLHPMTPEHLISNIWIEFADGSNKKVTLTSDDEPIAKFNIAGKSGKATVYEYCNLHGLWKTEIEL